MYLCNFCNEFSQPGEGVKLVVVQWRKIVYPCGSEGYEAAEILKSCPRCNKPNVNPPAIFIKPTKYFVEEVRNLRNLSGMEGFRHENSRNF